MGGAQISADVVILAALVGMFTGAKAMAVQNYLAVKSQREILESEIRREEFEIENLPNKERQEIVDIYTAKGFQGDELQKVVDKITSNKDVWLKTMLTEELGLNLEILGSPFRGALVMFGAFLLGGILPDLAIFRRQCWINFFRGLNSNSNRSQWSFFVYSRKWYKRSHGKEKLVQRWN